MYKKAREKEFLKSYIGSQNTMYDFKNSFFPNFLLIHRAKYIFSRDMFYLYHFRAKIHAVS